MILVTGASGFIGSKIFDSININYKCIGISNKNPKSSLKADLSKQENCKRILDIFTPDCIIHCAATPEPRPNFDNPNEIIEKNVSMTNNLLTYAPKGCKFILLSSIVVYGDCDYPKHAVDDKVNPKSVYAASKVASEALVTAFHNMGLIDGYILRLGATIGEGLKRGIVYDIINKLKSDPPNLSLLGEYPGTIKPYTHVDDISKFVRKLVLTYHKRKESPYIFNCANKDSISSYDVALNVMAGLGISKHIVFGGPTWMGDNNQLWVDTSNEENFGFLPETNSKETIRKVVKHYNG